MSKREFHRPHVRRAPLADGVYSPRALEGARSRVIAWMLDPCNAKWLLRVPDRLRGPRTGQPESERYAWLDWLLCEQGEPDTVARQLAVEARAAGARYAAEVLDALHLGALPVMAVLGPIPTLH